MQNRKVNLSKALLICALPLLFLACAKNQTEEESTVFYPSNVLNYTGTPSSTEDRSSLSWSDQGAWFSFGFPKPTQIMAGFTGPFLMTESNGIWSSPALFRLEVQVEGSKSPVDWTNTNLQSNAYLSHLEQTFESKEITLSQKLFFENSETATCISKITNTTDKPILIRSVIRGDSWLDHMKFKHDGTGFKLDFENEKTEGRLAFRSVSIANYLVNDSTYAVLFEPQRIEPGNSLTYVVNQSFWFKDSIETEITYSSEPEKILDQRIGEKQDQLAHLISAIPENIHDSIHRQLVSKTMLTLQNNWRTAAGELNHDGLFPSYHYEWFHGFWAWDSWKHAVALSRFNTELAWEQILAMYDYQEENGFIPDCVFRDTTIEKHNYRNTKPPLSGWAIWETFKQSRDTSFLKSIYPKLIKQHNWWYAYRDIDKDGLCEYGSTDGTLVAAKWDSGMDNAVRFDNSEILKIQNGVFVLNQESVDLNSYLFAEKNFLRHIAIVLNDSLSIDRYQEQADSLKAKIQNQFYDAKTAWFYDTTIDGSAFIKTMGCEGWIPLWAEAASDPQASTVKDIMMDSAHFNTYMPLPTLSAAHPKFKPDGGYWRGPNWIDQCYFGIKGLGNYGFAKEALELKNKLILNAKGLTESGPSIRENYHPVTGEGLEAENFSWSAAHYLLLTQE